MSAPDPRTSNDRTKGLGAFSLLAAAAGGLAGVAWMTVIGAWLADPGPLNAILGFALGGVLMVGVAGCHAELAGMMPRSGGAIVYANEVYGRFAAYVVGWFGLFVSVSTMSFEAVSFGWVVETLFPILRTPPLFHFLGAAVTLPQIIIGQTALWTIYAVNRRGLQTSARTQEVLTVVKFVIVIGFVLGGLLLGQPARALAFAPGEPSQLQLWKTLSFAATATYWLTPFTIVSQLAGDRSSKTSMRAVGVLMLVVVMLGAVIYIGIVMAAAAAAPIKDTIHAPFPADFAANAIFKNNWAGRVMLLAAAVAILSLMNAMLLSTSRVLHVFREIGAFGDRKGGVAQGRRQDDFILIVAAGAVGAAAGQGILIPLCNTGAMAAIISYFFMCHAALKLRMTDPARPRPFRLPGGAPLLIAILISMGLAVVFLLLQPLFTASERLPIEWLIFGGWAAVGGLFWWLVVRGQKARLPLSDALMAEPVRDRVWRREEPSR